MPFDDFYCEWKSFIPGTSLNRKQNKNKQGRDPPKTEMFKGSGAFTEEITVP